MFYQVLRGGRPTFVNLDHVTAIGPSTTSADAGRPYAMWIGRDPFREPESLGLTAGQYEEILGIVRAGPAPAAWPTTSRGPRPGVPEGAREADGDLDASMEGIVGDAMSDAPLRRAGRCDLPYWLRGVPQDES